jgi:hypothetical protein
MTKTIKNRLYDLENKTPNNLPPVVVSQDLDDPELWHEGPSYDRGQAITWGRVKEKYPDNPIIRVVYVDDWGRHDAGADR